MNRFVRRALMVPALWLAACTGSLFRSHATQPTAYMLSAGSASHGEPAPAAGRQPSGTPAAGRPAPEIPVDLAVLKPKARAGLESDRIAVLYPDRRLDYFADARWSGPLGEVLQDLAVQEFHSHGSLRTVSGDASVFASAYWLEIEITDFQAEYTSAATAPTVRVSLRARLGSSGDRHLVAQFAATAQKAAAENRLSSIVDAFANAADASLAEIAAQAGEKLASVSEAR
ncbi:MAG: ABC-type transport auxiliary lipoprotein family protein [Steroidobacteraceae bacterium]